MPITNVSVTGALVKLVIVVIVVGLLMGLAFAGTDLLNLPTAKARASEMERASRNQERVDEINLEYYEQERQVQAGEREEQYRQETEFQRRKQERDLAHHQERHALELGLLQIRETVLLSVVTVVLLLAGGSLAFYLISLGRRATPAQRDPWRSPEWRDSIRLMARTNERLLRRLKLYQQPTGEAVTAGGDGRHREPAWSED
jgi:hypothetical protein